MSSYEKVNEYIEKNPGISGSAACRKVGYSPKDFYNRRAYDLKKGVKTPFLKLTASSRGRSVSLPATIEKKPYTRAQPMYSVVAEPIRSTSRLMVIIGTNATEVADLVRSLQ